MRSVIVLVLSFLDAARSSAAPGTTQSMSKRPNRVVRGVGESWNSGERPDRAF